MIETKYRKIVTEIPTPESEKVIRELEAIEPRSMSGFLPVVFKKAEGFQIYDESGNMWLDFSSAVVLTNAGHANPIVKDYIQKQLDSNMLHSYCNPTRERLRVLKSLKKILPDYLDKAFLLTTGSEATECTIKLARIYGKNISPEKYTIISYYNSFHGRTMASQTAGGFIKQQEWMGKKPEGFYHIPYPECARCPWGKEKYDNCGKECFNKTLECMEQDGIVFKNIAAVITETFPGPTVAFMPQDYISELRKFTQGIDALLIFDEIQAGFGRTGKWFGFEHYDVKPDLIAMGKGMTSSLPMSAVAGRAKIMDLPVHGEMSSTHTGNPLCSAATIGNIEAISGGLLANASNMEDKVFKKYRQELLKEFGHRIAAFNGHGLAWGICFKKPGAKTEYDIDACNKICDICLKRGLIMLQTGRGTLKIAPPLCITEEALTEGLNLIREVMREVLL